MYFVPLNQIESVELVIHALRAAAGQADCSMCPAKKVCMQQCLTIADSIARMATEGTLPSLGDEPETVEAEVSEVAAEEAPAASAPPFLKVVK